MLIYGLKTCDSCRKARAATGAELRDIRAEPLSSEELDRLLAALGPALLNTRSATWRGLEPDQRARPARELLAAHPALMKRPVIAAADGALHLGWSPEVRARLGA